LATNKKENNLVMRSTEGKTQDGHVLIFGSAKGGKRGGHGKALKQKDATNLIDTRGRKTGTMPAKKCSATPNGKEEQPQGENGQKGVLGKPKG